jgi:heme exporter protein A
MTLQADQLACARGDSPLFAGIDFAIQPGEALWLSGRNGSGKTSLLRLLCGLAEPAAGSVRWRGADVRALREDFHRELIYCAHADSVKDDLSAWENVVFAARLAGHRCDRAQAYRALGAVGLQRAAHLPARALSQGQRKRVNLARLHVGRPAQVYVLDEPFNALDQAAVETLEATLNERLAQGAVVVYTTHQALALRASRLHRLDLHHHHLGQARPC